MVRKFATDPLLRWIVSIIGFVAFAVGTYYTLTSELAATTKSIRAHKKDNIAHMTETRRAEVIKMKSDIKYHALEIKRVEGDLKEDMKEIKENMNRGFREIKELIRSQQ